MWVIGSEYLERSGVGISVIDGGGAAAAGSVGTTAWEVSGIRVWA